MDTSKILHINSRYHTQDLFVEEIGKIGIRIRCGKDIDGVVVVYNDPYVRTVTENGLYWPYKKAEMKVSGETNEFKFFSVSIDALSRRLKYYFLIYSKDQVLQYSETGFTSGYNHDDMSMFFVPYIDKNRIHLPYSWLKNTVWYQILPSRFSNYKNSKNCNLKGIMSKLEYLKKLGITGLYLNPVYHGKSYHKYDVIDYEHIDPDFGTDEDFVLLCNKAHKMGMKVMMDISFTHCSSSNKFWLDVIKNKENSKYFDWFNIYKDEKGNFCYETFAYEKEMPKFNTENFKVIEYFCNKVVKKWMTLCNIDAWRIDVANEISDELLINVKNVMHSINPQSYIVGEIWHNASDWISKKRLDGVTNYALSRSILSFVCAPFHDVNKFKNDIICLLHSYSPCQIIMSMPLLDSHDTPRLRYMANQDKDKVKLSLFLLFTFYGAPSIYYGTERFMDGAGDPDCRRKADWKDTSPDTEEFFNITSTLIKLRKEHPELSNDGTYEFLNDEDILVFKRQSYNKTYWCVVNPNEYDTQCHLNFACGKKFKNIINGDTIFENIKMNRLGFMILEEDK